MFKLDNDLCICMKHHRKIDLFGIIFSSKHHRVSFSLLKKIDGLIEWLFDFYDFFLFWKLENWIFDNFKPIAEVDYIPFT